STPTGDAPAGRTADESTVYTGGPSPAGPTATMSGTTAAGAGVHGTYHAHTYDEVYQEPPKGPRMPTVAWGLVLVLLGLVVIAVGLGIDLQLELVFIGILGVAGLTLLVGALRGAGCREMWHPSVRPHPHPASVGARAYNTAALPMTAGELVGGAWAWL